MFEQLRPPPPGHTQGRPPKAQPTVGGMGNSPPSSPDQGGADSDSYSTASEMPDGHHWRRGWWKKHLAPVWLDMPVFKCTDPIDV